MTGVPNLAKVCEECAECRNSVILLFLPSVNATEHNPEAAGSSPGLTERDSGV